MNTVMKKYISILTIAAAFLFAGCNESLLDIDQKGVISMDAFYQTDDDAISALTTVYVDTYKNFAFMGEVTGYNYGPYFGLTNYQADDIYLAGSGPDDCVPEREFHDFRFNTENIVPLGGYTAFYRSIQKCNLLINNFEALNTTSPTIKRCIAEARVMRAFDHMMLGIYWGNPPIVTEVLSGSAQPENSESQKSVMEWVASEIELALPDLEERASTSDKDGAVKITKGFANAVKGKALIWAGEYSRAKTALEAVIKSGKYALLPGTEMGKILHANGKGNQEIVFEFNLTDDSNLVDYYSIASRDGWNDHMTFNWRFENLSGGTDGKTVITDPSINVNGWGWMNPTGTFAKALIENDGMDSYRRRAWIKTYDEVLYDLKWSNDDESFVPGKTAFKESDPERGIRGANEIYGNEGYFGWKNVVHPLQGDISVIGGQGARNFTIMRYAEVLLLYAEACIQSGDASTAKTYINMIQERAGSKTVSQSVDMDVLKREKQFELWLEGTRSADIIRWGDTKTLEEQDFYVPSLRDKLRDKKSDKHEGYIDESNADFYKRTYGATIGFKKGKNEFLPYPQKAVDLNKGLVQNPGW